MVLRCNRRRVSIQFQGQRTFLNEQQQLPFSLLRIRSPKAIRTRSPTRSPTRVLDAILAQDPKHSRVAAETLCTTGLVVLAGEITHGAPCRLSAVARDTIKRIGYDNTDYGIDYKGCSVLVAYGKQSQDIAQGVD